MSTNINLLMQKDPLELSAGDIDEIIAYQRRARASAESGQRAKKADNAPKIDLLALGILKGKQSAIVKRRI